MRVQLFCYVVVFGLVFFLIHVGIPFYSVAKRAIVFSVSTLELAASGSASGPSSRYDLCCFVWRGRGGKGRLCRLCSLLFMRGCCFSLFPLPFSLFFFFSGCLFCSCSFFPHCGALVVFVSHQLQLVCFILFALIIAFVSLYHSSHPWWCCIVLCIGDSRSSLLLPLPLPLSVFLSISWPLTSYKSSVLFFFFQGVCLFCLFCFFLYVHRAHTCFFFLSCISSYLLFSPHIQCRPFCGCVSFGGRDRSSHWCPVAYLILCCLLCEHLSLSLCVLRLLLQDDEQKTAKHTATTIDTVCLHNVTELEWACGACYF